MSNSYYSSAVTLPWATVTAADHPASAGEARRLLIEEVEGEAAIDAKLPPAEDEAAAAEREAAQDRDADTAQRARRRAHPASIVTLSG